MDIGPKRGVRSGLHGIFAILMGCPAFAPGLYVLAITGEATDATMQRVRYLLWVLVSGFFFKNRKKPKWVLGVEPFEVLPEVTVKALGNKGQGTVLSQNA
jgi:hypothetical protein